MKKAWEMDGNQFKTFVFLLCYASMHAHKSGKFEIDEDTFERLSGISKKILITCVDFLSDNKVLTVSSQCKRSASAAQAQRTHSATDVHTDTTQQNEHISRETRFDFLSIYSKYPLKKGKEIGLKRCKAQIKTEKDFHSLGIAVDTYTRQCKLEGTLPKFIMHFSKFMNTWRDFLDTDYGEATNNSESRYEGVFNE